MQRVDDRGRDVQDVGQVIALLHRLGFQRGTGPLGLTHQHVNEQRTESDKEQPLEGLDRRQQRDILREQPDGPVRDQDPGRSEQQEEGNDADSGHAVGGVARRRWRIFNPARTWIGHK